MSVIDQIEGTMNLEISKQSFLYETDFGEKTEKLKTLMQQVKMVNENAKEDKIPYISLNSIEGRPFLEIEAKRVYEYLCEKNLIPKENLEYFESYMADSDYGFKPDDLNGFIAWGKSKGYPEFKKIENNISIEGLVRFNLDNFDAEDYYSSIVNKWERTIKNNNKEIWEALIDKTNTEKDEMEEEIGER